MSHGRDVAQLAAMQTGRNDPWHERRTSDPVLRAVIGVLAEHTQVSYDVVDWRGHLFGPGCPAEQAHVDRGLVQDPDACCGSQSIPYNEGGGGYLERFAKDLGAFAAAAGTSVSAAILVLLRDAYDREVASHAEHRGEHPTMRARPARMTFEEILAAAHWTPAVLEAIDAAVVRERGVQEDVAIDARGGQLDLFAGASA